jgi:hypothetical protein
MMDKIAMPTLSVKDILAAPRPIPSNATTTLGAVAIPAQLQPAECPTFKKALPDNETVQFNSFGDHVIWWRCPVCQGWHVFLIDPTAIQPLTE